MGKAHKKAITGHFKACFRYAPAHFKTPVNAALAAAGRKQRFCRN